MKTLFLGISMLSLALLSCKESPKEMPAEKAPPQSVEAAKEYTPKLPTRRIQIDTCSIVVEVAETPEDRARGLMFRTYLPDSVGMLFVFEAEATHSFWMKNTLIPLSIAFIGADSVITDIKWMKPGDLSSHYPSKPVLYALEMNRNWFTNKGIRPGAKVRLFE